MMPRLIQIDLPALGLLVRQHMEIAHNHRRTVEMNTLDRQPPHALRQVIGFGKQPLADFGCRQIGEFLRIVAQIPGDDFVAVDRMAGQRPHHRHEAMQRRQHARNMQKGLCLVLGDRQTQFLRHPVFFVQRQGKVKQLGLHGFQQTRQGQGGAHIRQGIVRRIVLQAIGRTEVLQPETGGSIFVLGPVDVIRPQRMRQPHHVQQIPSAASVLPFAPIRINQVAPKQEPGEFIVEADAVVSNTNGSRL